MKLTSTPSPPAEVLDIKEVKAIAPEALLLCQWHRIRVQQLVAHYQQ
ncbi:hypothetical protein [Laspinema olomoucense]|uniref:Uncharacterized protein n=1 Tax=Laspinema olomoucense D3b TaxID=2953688 RepID=A0ABT2NE84_9CYAN|nr:hypothetical protein [Laspinema sp. D3b]MCT7980055.1 hypothetical protein [Laspinema sp. D3b]